MKTSRTYRALNDPTTDDFARANAAGRRAKGEAESRARVPRRCWSHRRSAWLLAGVALVALAGCDALPPKPDVFFNVYRERMASGAIEEARALLTPQSRDILAEMDSKLTSGAPPEQTALLDSLDPAAPPVILQEGAGYAILQLRTRTGGMKTLHLVRPDPKSHWRVDLSEELRNLKLFLEAKGALEAIREQAGDYAAFYRAMTDRLGDTRRDERGTGRTDASDQKVKDTSPPGEKAGKTSKGEKGGGEK
jgi:hypothetical protein